MPLKNIRFAFLWITAFACSPSTFAGEITYSVNPVALSNEYLVEGGFIKTDGTIGQLDASNILDYEFRVTGPKSQTFTPDAENHQLTRFQNVEATPTDILLPIVKPIFEGNAASIRMTQGPPGDAFSFVYVNDSGFDISYVGFNEIAPATNELGELVVSPQIVQRIATVPEPSTAVLSCLGFACLLARRRKTLSCD